MKDLRINVDICGGKNECVEVKNVLDIEATSSEKDASVTKYGATGGKRSLESMQINPALHFGAEAIEGLVLQSKKRNDISVQSLAFDQRNSRISLLTMPGTDPKIVKNFMKTEQHLV